MMMESASFFSSVLLLVLMTSPSVLAEAKKEEERGHWGEWSGFTACSSTCGSGSMQIARKWIPGTNEKKPDKPFTSTRTYACSNKDMPLCPVDGVWTGWMPWSRCSKQCGQGTKKRYRDCRGRSKGGKLCDGDGDEEVHCNRKPCPALPRHFQMSQCTNKNFTCASKLMCVGGSMKCDGEVQCHDGSDESECTRRPGTGSVRYDLRGEASLISMARPLQLVTAILVVSSLADILRQPQTS